MKVGTDIIPSRTVSLIRLAVILVVIYVKTLNTEVIIFIGNVIMWLTDNCQYLGHFDTKNSVQWDQRKNA